MTIPKSSSLPDRLSSFLVSSFQPFRRSTSTSRLSRFTRLVTARSSKNILEVNDEDISTAPDVEKGADDQAPGPEKCVSQEQAGQALTSAKNSLHASDISGKSSSTGSFAFSRAGSNDASSTTSVGSTHQKEDGAETTSATLGTVDHCGEPTDSPNNRFPVHMIVRRLSEGGEEDDVGENVLFDPPPTSNLGSGSIGPLSLLPNSEITSTVNLMLRPTSELAHTNGPGAFLPTSRGLITLDTNLDNEDSGSFFPQLLCATSDHTSNNTSSSTDLGITSDPTSTTIPCTDSITTTTAALALIALSREDSPRPRAKPRPLLVAPTSPKGPNGEPLSDDIDAPDYKHWLLTPNARFRALCRSKVLQARARIRAYELLRSPPILPLVFEPISPARPAILSGLDISSPLRWESWTWEDFVEFVLLEQRLLGAEGREEVMLATSGSFSSLMSLHIKTSRSWSAFFKDRDVRITEPIGGGSLADRDE
ncbi:hypothetical protein DL93DRAFT_293865 [Clavulina sp. PMI_390]|nr:hypothetical protein DL93DRAFT_293865 [Clavulina sp. PMI_390]